MLDVYELKELQETIACGNDWEKVYVYINGERINVKRIISRNDNGLIEIYIDTEEKNV